jgi:hypothetical protein
VAKDADRKPRKTAAGRIVRRRASDLPGATVEDLARARAAMDRPIDTSDIPERKGPVRRLYRDEAGRPSRKPPPVAIDSENVCRLVEMGLTDRQAGIFVYLFEHTRQYGFQPSIRELGDKFAISSLNGVMTHLRSLAHKGWIEQSHSQSRAVRFLRTPTGDRFCGFVCQGSEQ